MASEVSPPILRTFAKNIEIDTLEKELLIKNGDSS